MNMKKVFGGMLFGAALTVFVFPSFAKAEEPISVTGVVENLDMGGQVSSNFALNLPEMHVGKAPVALVLTGACNDGKGASIALQRMLTGSLREKCIDRVLRHGGYVLVSEVHATDGHSRQVFVSRDGRRNFIVKFSPDDPNHIKHFVVEIKDIEQPFVGKDF